MRTDKKILFVFIIAVVLVAGLGSKLHISLNQPLNSDSAQSAVMFYDMAENSNFLLKGWRIPLNPYLFTDFPLYVLTGALAGMGPLTVKATALLVYVLCALMLGLAIHQTLGQTHGARTMWAAVCIVMALPLYPSSYLLKPSEHQGTLMVSFALLALVLALLRRYASNAGAPENKHLALSGTVLFVFGAAGVFSDMYILVSFYAPLGAAWAVLRLRGHRLMPARHEMAVGGVLVASILAGLAMSKAAPLMGLTFADSGLHVQGAEDFTEKLGALGTFAVNAFELDPGQFGPVAVANIAVLTGAVGFAIYLLAREQDPVRLFTGAFFAAFVVVLCGALLVLKHTSFRYFTPVVFAFAAFAAMFLGGGYLRAPKVRAGVAIVLVLLGGYHIYNGFGFRGEQAQDELVALLEREGLTYGYAEYWHSNIITLMSENTVRVRPVDDRLLKMHFAPKGGRRIIPGRVFRANHWYHPTRHKGRVFYLNHKEQHAFSESVLLNFFGPPQQKLETGDYTVYVWGENVFAGMLSIPQWNDNPDLIGQIESEGDVWYRVARKGEAGVLSISKPFPVVDTAYRAVFEIETSGEDSAGKAADLYVYRITPGSESVDIIAQRPVEPTPEWEYRTIGFEGDEENRYLLVLKTTGEATVKVRTVFLEAD
jgi:hypothetical protein